MEEILKKLLENEMLSESTKAEISEQWDATVKTFKTQVREEVELTVRSELSEQWITERDELVAKVDEFVAAALVKEVQELHGDIERFRDLEAEYAGKIVEAKHALAEEVATELDELVDKIDAFFEVRLAAEISELAEDLAIVKQNEFGKRIFEAYAKTFAEVHIDEESVTAQLALAEAKLADAEISLASSEESRGTLVREAKLNKILAPLSGKKREQMEMVLKSIDTERLEESYKFFIGRVLKEDAAPAATLTEGVSGVQKTTVVTGDAPMETVPAKEALVESQRIIDLKRRAGITA